jgi:glycosyltransferase 2 family protein
VRRISASPWVRAALLLVALGFAVWGLVSKWPQVHSALTELAWYDVAGAALAVIAALGFQMLAWRALLADLGSPLPLAAAVRVNFLGQLGKYLPGALWAMAGQVSLAQDYRVPKRRSGAASLVSMAITLVVGLAMAGIVLPLASAGALRHYWWVLICIPVLLVGLWPTVTKFGIDLALRLVKRPRLDRPLTLGGMGRAVGWTTLAWICYGLHAWLLIGDIAGKSLHILLLSAGGYALAWAVGFLLIPFPGGIGPRELALIAVLSPVMSQGPALVVALASRVVMTVGDLLWAGVAVTVGRKGREGLAGGQGLPGSEGQMGREAGSRPTGPERVSGLAGREGKPEISGPLVAGREDSGPGQVPAGVRSSAGRPGTPSSSDPDQRPAPPNATAPPPPAH